MFFFYLCPHHRPSSPPPPQTPIPSFPPSYLCSLSLPPSSFFLPFLHPSIYPCSCLSIHLSLPHTAPLTIANLPVLPIVMVLVSRGMSKGAYLSVSSTWKDSSTSSEASFSIVISTQCSWLLSVNETVFLMPIKSIPPVEEIDMLHPKMQRCTLYNVSMWLQTEMEVWQTKTTPLLIMWSWPGRPWTEDHTPLDHVREARQAMDWRPHPSWSCEGGPAGHGLKTTPLLIMWSWPTRPWTEDHTPLDHLREAHQAMDWRPHPCWSWCLLLQVNGQVLHFYTCYTLSLIPRPRPAFRRFQFNFSFVHGESLGMRLLHPKMQRFLI